MGEKTYFKDIYEYLSNLYPNRNIYVLADEHFYHKKIIDYSRGEFSSVEEMNDALIEKHNSVVGEDDIVLFLGDFCFQNSKIAEIASKLNGHKFLIMGNHDQDKFLKDYHELGFENVFLRPTKMDNLIFSHEPILDDSDNILLSLMKKEFSLSDSYFNYHGHIHGPSSYDRSYNSVAEFNNYTPILIGRTKEKTEKRTPLIYNSNTFEDAAALCKVISGCEKDVIVSDYIYSMMLDAATPYIDTTLFSGSFPMFKKYGMVSKFSDLDGSVLYDSSRSKKFNTGTLKSVSESVFYALNKIPTFNLDYDKRMSGIYILGNYFNDGQVHKQTYLDLNLIYREVYKASDYYTFEGCSFLEKLLKEKDSSFLDEYDFPKFKMNVLNPSGDLANLLLQFLFQDSGSEQKKKVLKKIKFICHTITPDSIDYKQIEDQVIRFFLRNIYFFDMTNRKNEIYHLFNKDYTKDIDLLKNYISDEFMGIVEYIFYYSNFVLNYRHLKESSDKIAAADEILEAQNKR